MHIDDSKCGPLTETVSLLLEPYEGKGCHVYQDKYYNSVRPAEELLQTSIPVCGTIRVIVVCPRTWYKKQNAEEG
jgi:hypothetical protein